jgi:predicted O-methyltransferase YrrM
MKNVAEVLDGRNDLHAWISSLYADPELLRMGHNQSAEDLNLGLGWIYYGMARLMRPGNVVVIGSWRGFVPMVIARALQDNRDPGEVTFIDPSLADDFWKNPEVTQRYFASFGLGNIRHQLCTTQQFVATDAYHQLADVGLLFIDGYHTAEQARFDYEAFVDKLGPRAFVLFHDSMIERTSPIYGPDQLYTVNVRDYINELRNDSTLQLLDLPFGTGLTVLRRHAGKSEQPLLKGREGRT